MKQKRLFIILFVLLTAISLLFTSLVLASSVTNTVAEKAKAQNDDTDIESEKALFAEQMTERLQQTIKTNRSGGDGPLFVGLDDATVPAFRIDVDTNTFSQAFVGVEVWGAAYDSDNNRVLFSDGTGLFEWPIGGSVNFLATVSDTTGTNVSMEGLAYYDGTLYASKAGSTGEGEGIYDVDLTTFQATRVIAFADNSQTTISGLDADPVTGKLYGTNDATALRGLVEIGANGTITVITDYQAGETDVDGLAIGDNKAYLITDDQTPNHFEVFDLVAMTYITPVVTPFTTTEVFAAGAWIAPSAGPNINLVKTVGTDSGTCATSNTVDVEAGTTVTYCYEIFNTGDVTFTLHDLDDSELGTILSGFAFSLAPGASTFLTQSAVINVTTVNTATWTAYNAGPTDVVSDTDIATVNVVPPSISLAKTVGTDSTGCSNNTSISVISNTVVYYCYEVTNTGQTTLGLHDLDDSELGTILSGFAFTLTPGTSTFLTQEATITQTTINTATWTAYNSGPTDIVSDTASAEVSVIASAPYPVCADFETGSLPGYFYTETTSNGGANGRVTVTNAFPHTGSFAMDLDTDCDNCGGATQQAAIMAVDLAGESGVTLDFWVFEHFDEDNPEDGVFVSDDGGVTWAEIQTLNGFPANYEQVVIDLDAAVSGVGMSYVDGFLIKFQSLDGATIPGNDGYSFDDICIEPGQPDIVVTPTSLSSTQFENEVVTQSLTIDNVGSLELNWTIAEAPTDCASPADVPWANAAPTSGATAAQGSDSVAVGFDSTGLAVGTYNGLLCVNSDDPDTPVITVSLTMTVEGSPAIVVTPSELASTQQPDVQVAQTLTISNMGTADLDWEITELPAVAPAAPEHLPAAQPLAPSVVIDAEQCSLYENYAGAEPAGYAQHCLGIAPQAQTALEAAGSFDPTDTGFAHDIRNTGNFVSFTLNDFPGQTAVGTNANIYWGMDFDASATTLYAIEDMGNSASPDTLGTIDTTTGDYTAIATIANPNAGIFSGLAIDTDGTFYLSDATQLFTVDPGTGVVTLVGNFNAGGIMIDIDISPTGQMYGHDISDDAIYAIDKATGAATLIGATGFAGNFAQGMSFDNIDGTLYIFLYTGGGTNTYGTVNLATGAVTPLAQDNPLGEFEGATQTVAASACSGDIPWVSASPTSGTTGAGNASTVEVTFDSTGLAVGVYTGTLCVNSNDLANPLVTVPLTLTVVLNQTPIAVDDAYTTTQEVALTVVAPGVLANDTDGDGGMLTAVLDSGPSNGSVTLNADGSFTYTPAVGFEGTDSFTYHANDGVSDSNVATVTITVLNTAPVAVADAYTVDQDTVLAVAAPGVLDNDSDADGDGLTAVLDSSVANGTLTLNADGSFTYTPDAGFTGTDSFTYHANDGTGDSNVVTVTITVEEVGFTLYLPFVVKN